MAVHPQVYEYFEKNHLFHPHQYGAIKNHSTATAVIHVHESWLEAVEKNLISASCYLDQTAAYDLLSHQVLEKKLELYTGTGTLNSGLHRILADEANQFK